MIVQDVQMKKRRESESQIEEIGGVVVRARSVTVGSVTLASDDGLSD